MLTAESAYYIKLGRGGEWATIKKALQTRSKTVGAGTMDANALELFCRSTDDEVWITFHGSKLWWGRLSGPVKGGRDLEVPRASRRVA